MNEIEQLRADLEEAYKAILGHPFFTGNKPKGEAPYWDYCHESWAQRYENVIKKARSARRGQ